MYISGELESVQENAFEVQVELTAYKLRYECVGGGSHTSLKHHVDDNVWKYARDHWSDQLLIRTPSCVCVLFLVGRFLVLVSMCCVVVFVGCLM